LKLFNELKVEWKSISILIEKEANKVPCGGIYSSNGGAAKIVFFVSNTLKMIEA